MARDVGDAGCADRVKQRWDCFFSCVNKRVVRIHVAEGVRVGGDDERETVFCRDCRGFFVAIKAAGIKPCMLNGIDEINVPLKKSLEREITVGKRVRRQHQALGVRRAVCAQIGKCLDAIGLGDAVEDNEMPAAAGMAMPAGRRIAPPAPRVIGAGIRGVDIDLNARDEQDVAAGGVRRVCRSPRGALMAGDGERVKAERCRIINALLGAVRHEVLRIVCGMKMKIGFESHSA